eukprot:snap_masked-scaffold_3-processed-gene-20.12-mRNA-1 protein AED:1.00 eAED:1.00 QI:0/-1/0/0/-1/1/1/0/408
MGGEVSTNSICEFPFTFENNNDFKGEERFDPANEGECTLTMGDFYGPFWDFMHFGFLFLYFGIYIPMFLYRMYNLNNYATQNRKKITDTVQFNIFFYMTITVIIQGLASIDVHGLDNVMPIQAYLILTEFSLVPLLLTAIYVIDFLIKTSDARFRRVGISKKLVKTASVLLLIFYPGIGTIAVLNLDVYNVIIGVRRLFEAAEAFSIFLISRHYKNKLIRKLDSMNFTAGSGKSAVSKKIEKSFFQYNCVLIFVVFLSLLLGLSALSDANNGEEQLTYDVEDPGVLINIVVGRIFLATVPGAVLYVFKSPTKSSMASSPTSPSQQISTFGTKTLPNSSSSVTVPSYVVNDLKQNALLSYSSSSVATVKRLRATELLKPSEGWNRSGTRSPLPPFSPRGSKFDSSGDTY